MNDVATVAGSRQETAGLLQATLTALRGSKAEISGAIAADRAHAAAFLEASGFPTQHDEAWRFTPLWPLLRVPYIRRDVPVRMGDLRGSASHASQRVVLVNGVARDVSSNSSLEVRRLSDVLRTEPARVFGYLGRVATTEHGFVAQNTALFDDGLVVFARSGTRERLELVHVAAPGDGPTLSTPRVLVVAEAGSELLLVESHESLGGELHLENSVTELSVGENAALEHVRVHHGSAHASSIATVAVRQAKDSRYRSRVFTLGGCLARLELAVAFEGPGGECVLDGLYLARDGELVDHHTVVSHGAKHCSSRERYKGILDGRGVAVFDGTVFVRAGASGTEAHQENRNLLLSNDAVLHTKPHLEIDTDDVKCSHGATVGKLDPAQLFYLRSRGMDETVARSLLTYAFAREMAELIGDPALRKSIEAAIAEFLPDGASARELA